MARAIGSSHEDVMTPPIRSAPPAPEVRSCPFCGSSLIISLGKGLETDKYWRCQACGDIWNAGRLQVVTNPRWSR